GVKSMQSDQYSDNDATDQDASILQGGWGGTARDSRLMGRDDPTFASPFNWGSSFAGVTIFAFCDGSVRSIPYTQSNTDNFEWMLRPNDARTVTFED
ncbi:MAG: hypothetical protein ACRCZF_19470, partial [Gemmataceae bacterium]